MKKYFIAAALIVAFATPALADEIFVMLDMSTKKCVTMATNSQRYEKVQDARQISHAGRSRNRDAHNDRV